MASQKKINTVVDHALFRKLIENSDEIITLIDKDFKVIYRSQSAARVTGHHSENGVDIPVIELFNEIDNQRVTEVFKEITKELGLSRTLTFQVKHADGHLMWMESKFKNMLQDEDVQAIVCTSKDITQQMVINERLADEQRHLKLLETVITHTKDAVMITEAEPQSEPGPKILYVNEAFTTMTGYTAEEVIGRSPRFLQGAKTDFSQLRKMREAMLAWQPCEITIVNYKKNGEEFWVNIAITPVANEKGWYTHWIAIEHDITEKRELEDLLHTATNLAGIGGWDYHLASQTVYWSNITKQIFEVDADFQPNLSEALDFYRKRSDRQMVQLNLEQSIKQGKSFDLELEMVTAKKKSKWVRITGEPEIIGGRCLRIRGSFQDIDVRKCAEILAKDTLEEKDHILESIGDGFFAVNNQWVVTYWNSKAENVLSHVKSDMLNRKLWNVFPESVGTKSYQHFNYAIANKVAVHFQDYHANLQKWFEVRAYPSPSGLSVYFKDITERKITEKQIFDSEKRYSELFQLSPLPQWVFDTETLKFLDVNAAAIEQYGYTYDEFMEMTIKYIRPNAELKKLEDTLRNSRDKKYFIQQGVFTHCKKNGELIQVEIQSNLIEFKGREAKIIIANNITDRLTYINAIEEQNEKLKEVSWIQSHLFRAPLSRIMGLVEVAKFADDPAEKEEVLGYILSSATELDDVIKDVTAKTKVNQKSEGSSPSVN